MGMVSISSPEKEEEAKKAEKKVTSETKKKGKEQKSDLKPKSNSSFVAWLAKLLFSQKEFPLNVIVIENTQDFSNIPK